MTYQVITSNQVVGVHRWVDAPMKYIYLTYPHRHVFHIRCWFPVGHVDREIEINKMQDTIQTVIESKYGNRPGTGADFGGMSCESIAEWCIETFECDACEVLEDGYGGAYVRK